MAPLRRLLALAGEQRVRLGVGVVMLGLSSSATLAFPRLVEQLLDEGFAQGNADALDRMGAILFGLFILQTAASAARFYLFTVAGERIVADLRARLFRRFVHEPMSFFDAHRTGELMSRLGSDTQLIQSAVSVNISMALRALVSALGSAALMFWISARLAGLMVLVVPPVAIGAVLFGRKVRKRSKEAQDALALASEVAEETLGAMRTVRSFSAEDREARRYAERIEQSFTSSQRRIVASTVFFTGASLAAFTAMMAVLLYGGHLTLRGELSAGSLASFGLYTIIIAFSLGSLADLWSDFMRAVGAAQRVFDFLDRPVSDAAGQDRADRARGRLVFEGVGFSYPQRPDVQVLEGVDLELEPGRSLALVGPSGAGKSTIVSLLLAYYVPTRGSILLDDRDLSDWDAEWLRTQIGLVAQEPVLFSASIEENIRYGRPSATPEEVRRAATDAFADGFIRELPEGYATQVGERGVQLSGGQRQRVAIARALLEDPPILILDEATSALDAEAEALVKRALDRLRRGRTTLIVAHRLSTVKDADLVVVMDHGRVVESGDHGALMEKEEGLYRRLVAHQLTA